MARRIPQGRKTSRKLGKENVKLIISAVCEGANTEPEYLIEFVNHYGNKLVKVEPVRAAGAPVTIVNKAVEKKRELQQRSKKTGFSGLYEVWAIFDIDEHPNISQACDKAKGNNIKLAISNPCFEIWPLLHYTNHRRPLHRHELQKKLAREMPSYDPNSSKKLDFMELVDNYEKAVDRAQKINDEHEKAGDKEGNPSTGIYKLLKKIEEQGKKK